MANDRISIDGAHTKELTSNASDYYKDYWVKAEGVSEESLKRHAEILQHVFYEKPQALKIAELGVGAEGGVVSLIKENNSVYGFDVSETAITACLENGISAKLYNADIDKFEFEDSYLDVLFACEVFEHFSNPQHALEEIRRVLKPGGLLAVSIPSPLIHHWPRLFYQALFDKVPFREFLMINKFKVCKELAIGSTRYKSVAGHGEDAWSWFWVCENIKVQDAVTLFQYGQYFFEKRNHLGVRVSAIEASDMFRSSWESDTSNLEAAFALALSLVYRVINGEVNEFKKLISLVEKHANDTNSKFSYSAQKYMQLIKSELSLFGIS